jgi:serine/threonine protein kinase
MLAEVKREAEVLSRIQHPLLLRFYGVCVTSKDIYLVTELMWGSLNDLIYGRSETPAQPLPTVLFFKTIRDIARGMAYLHSTGFVHRDLKVRHEEIASRLLTLLSHLSSHLSYRLSYCSSPAYLLTLISLLLSFGLLPPASISHHR